MTNLGALFPSAGLFEGSSKAISADALWLTRPDGVEFGALGVEAAAAAAAAATAFSLGVLDLSLAPDPPGLTLRFRHLSCKHWGAGAK